MRLFQTKRALERELKLADEQIRAYMTALQSARDRALFWQARYHSLRLENNALRRKLRQPTQREHLCERCHVAVIQGEAQLCENCIAACRLLWYPTPDEVTS